DGSALSIFEAAQGGEKDIRLIRKVLSSGHKTILEHIGVTVAFDQVSVVVEQAMIEARLNAFTVKSRRYVNFSDAGYVLPEGLDAGVAGRYRAYMDDCFDRYGKLLALGVPKEDARYVLPYSFRSNFYMTLNARGLLQVIMMLTKGRGSRFPELRRLGEQLREQFEQLLPGVCAQEERHCAPGFAAPLPERFGEGAPVRNRVELLRAPEGAEGLLSDAMAFSGRIPAGRPARPDELEALLSDARPRELEELNYAFLVRGVSQSCITHFVRHRIQSILVPEAAQALAKGDFVLPESIAGNPEALAIYAPAFRRAAKLLPEVLEAGMPACHAMYFVLSGHVSDIRLSMNARELLHFLKLRTCNRAQWEIRDAAWQMQRLLEQTYPALFGLYGPSCKVEGRCPEGKLTCGRPYER
ncbi:MAG: FAD-dependent thymidylate synthase, partial [Clostridia bacterium]|nr:FAD-dependent thymidylate synthase [Clostridia bacterium]